MRTMKLSTNECWLLLVIVSTLASHTIAQCLNPPCHICSNPNIKPINNDTVVDMTSMAILGASNMTKCQDLIELGAQGFYSTVLCLDIQQRIDVQILCGCAQRIGERTPSGRSIAYSNAPSATPTSSPTIPTLQKATIQSFGNAELGFSQAQKKMQPTIAPTSSPAAPSVSPITEANPTPRTVKRVPVPPVTKMVSTSVPTYSDHKKSVEHSYGLNKSNLPDVKQQIKTTLKAISGETDNNKERNNKKQQRSKMRKDNDNVTEGHLRSRR